MLIKNAIILGAGYGTRLGGCVKPLLEVAGKPLISNIISKLEEVESLEKVYVVTNDLYNQKFVEWSKSVQTRLNITLINDGTKSNDERLGALRDIVFVLNRVYREDIKDTIIIAGDNFFSGSLKTMAENYSQKPLVAVYDVKDLERAKHFGVVELDSKNRIISFEEKPDIPKTSMSATAIYIYPSSTLKSLKEYISKGLPSDRPGDFISWLVKNGHSVYAYELKEWWDIGSQESLDDLRKRSWK